MKFRRFAIICTTLLVIVLFSVYAQSQRSTQGVLSIPSPSPHINQSTTYTPLTIRYEDVAYSYDYIMVDALPKLLLIPNFVSQSKAHALVQTHTCRAAINGGFYSTDKKPLGVFVSKEYVQNNPLQSALFNGFFEYTDTKADIVTVFDPGYTSALQSGPVLIQHASPIPLHIANDEHARRTVVGITNDERVIFITVYIQNSIYNGPLLEELPLILKRIETDLNLSFTSALNLDGGSATYFQSASLELPELSPIGSLFCLQN